MKRIPAVIAVMVLVSATLESQGGRHTGKIPPPANPPRTVDEAVVALKTTWLKPKDLDWILRNPQKEVVTTLYRPFGMGVRNQFGLWGSNQELRDSCGTNDPEGCSVVILNRLWESVRSDADPGVVRQLECQFHLTEEIRINYKDFYKLTTDQLIKQMQTQIDQQVAKFTATGTSACANSLVLETAGNPDTHCFVAAPFARVRGEQTKEATLAEVLRWLGFQNLFMTSHVPPKIVLDFARKCQFPTPPYLYGSPH